MNLFEFLKPLILNDESFTTHFLNFIRVQLKQLKEDALDYTISDLILSYCSRGMGLSRMHSTLKSIDSAYLNELLLFKDFPEFRDFKNSIPEKWKDKRYFTIVEGLFILQKYGTDKKLGINEKHKIYLVHLKAIKQSENLLKKDLEGLLGASNLFKKNIDDKKKNMRKSNSVWTVKNK